MPNYCQFSSCSYQAGIIDTSYCIFHRFKCIDNNCSQRLYNWTYCAEHKNRFCERCKEVNIHLFSKNIMEENSTRPRCICHFENYQNLVTIMYGRIIDNEKTQLKSLVKQRTSISGNIEEVERFTTWWSKENIATIITHWNNYYWVFLGVIDRKANASGKVQNNEIFVYPTNPYESKWGIYPRKEHDSLAYAQSEASWLRTKLNGDNPMLVIHPLANSYTSFNNIVCEPYVRVDYNASINNLRPLDIIWSLEEIVKGLPFSFYHVGIYLGNNKICHMTRERNGVRITNWEGFLGGDTTGELIRYHPIIPFKNYQDIIRQAVWTECNFWENRYCLANRNCEHLANTIILGINFSKQVYDRPESSVSACPVSACSLWNGRCKDINGNYTPQGNNNKGSTICLRNEIKDNDCCFSKTNDYETREYENEYEARIEQPVNINNCVIM